MILDCGCGSNSLNRLPPEHKKTIAVEDFAESCSIKNKNCDNGCSYETYDSLKMSLIPGGEYRIGTDKPVFKSDRESPERLIKQQSFWMDKYEVSNSDFRHFIKETGYVTEAETFGNYCSATCLIYIIVFTNNGIFKCVIR